MGRAQGCGPPTLLNLALLGGGCKGGVFVGEEACLQWSPRQPLWKEGLPSSEEDGCVAKSPVFAWIRHESSTQAGIRSFSASIFLGSAFASARLGASRVSLEWLWQPWQQDSASFTGVTRHLSELEWRSLRVDGDKCVWSEEAMARCAQVAMLFACLSHPTGKPQVVLAITRRWSPSLQHERCFFNQDAC